MERVLGLGQVLLRPLSTRPPLSTAVGTASVMNVVDILDVIGLVAVAGIFSSMAFFSFVIAPVTFIHLDEATAGRFIRSLFPWYYLTLIILPVIAAASLSATRYADTSIMALIAFGAVISRQILMPRINDYRDRMLSGNPAAEKKFNRLHRLSILINGVQLLGAFAVLVHLAIT